MKLKHLLLSVLLLITTINAEFSKEDFSKAFELLQKGEFTQAEKLLIPIAESGDLPTQALLGQMYLYKQKDYDKAFKWVSIAVENGHKDALFDLANMYSAGHGVNQDVQKAFNLYLQSAEQGMDFAQLEVAMAYQLGKGIEMDLEKAAYWHKKSAQNDIQKSHLVLGTMYYSGIGIERDVAEARYWLYRAIKGGGGFAEDARYLLELIDEADGARDIDGQIEKSLEQARKSNFEKAKELILDLANNGNTDAQFLLSRYYRDPNGLNQLEIAAEWLYKSAKNNNSKAQFDIAMQLSILSEKGLVATDIEEIVKIIYWMEKAGYNGNTRAYDYLAVLYDKEHRDYLSEMEQAAYDGNPMAQYNMGWINARGLLTEDGLTQDRDVAEKWFKKSAKQGFKDAILILKRDYES